MRLTEAVRSALAAIAANALRSLLTMLGIVIGVAAVIAMVAIGSGARNLVDRQIRSLGANLAIVSPGNVTQGGARLGAGAASTLTDEEAAAIRDEIEGAVAAAPFVNGRSQVVAGSVNWNTNVYGIDLDWFTAREWDVEIGRGFDPERAGPASDRRSLGLLGMRERVGLVGGTLLVDSAEGEGTTVRVRVPLPQPAEEAGRDA